MIDRASPLYWDSNLFLAYLERAPERVESIEALLAEALLGNVRIYTATVSVAEVAFVGAERVSGVLDPMVPTRIADLWADEIVRVVDVSVRVARTARDLVRASLVAGPRLKPTDAIHLATAMSVGAVTFHTYDKALHQHPGRYGFLISVP